MTDLRLNIGTKVLLLALLLALPPLLVVSFFGLSSLNVARDSAVSSATNALRAQAEANLVQRATDKSQLYNRTLASVQQQLEATARYGTILLTTTPPADADGRVWIAPDGPSPAKEAQHAEAVARARQFIPLLSAAERSNPLISLAYIGFEDGGVASFDHDIIDVLDGIKPFDVRQRPWYMAARDAGETVWVDTYIDANTKAPVVTCATPLYDYQGKLIGVFGFDMLLTTIQQDVLQVDPGSHGYVFLINSQGNVIVKPHMPVSGATWEKPLTDENLLQTSDPLQRAVFERMTRQQQGVEQLMYQGDNVYLAFAPIPTASWSVGIVVPQSEVSGAAANVGGVIANSQQILRNQIFTVMLLSLLAVVVLGVLLSSLLTRPLRQLATGAQRIADGDLSHTIPATGEDEIGDVVRSFNVMTASLRQKVTELEDGLRTFATLNEVSNRFKTIRSLPRLLEAIPAAVRRDFGFDRAVLYLLDHDRLRAISASFGPENEAQAAQFIAVANAEPLMLDGATVEADVVRSGQAVIVDNPWTHPRVVQAKQSVSGSNSYVQVPIFGHDERVIGLLSADYHDRQQAISARDAAQLLTFANMVGLTIENARLNNDLERQVTQRTAELRIALERAREADRLKGQFLASISHELRTPLNAIIGFSTVLLDEIDGPLTPMQTEDINTINQNGRFLLHLITELLDLARIDAGKLELQCEPIAIAALIHEVTDTIQGLLYGKPVELRVTLAPDLPLILADRAKLRQILLNILSNAAKFTEQGAIVISARLAALPQPVNGAAEAETIERFVAISIRDSGIGIAAANLPLIFEEFRQVHAARNSGRGSGLGLAITRKLVEAMHGRIWVESTLDEGSTFTFTIPVATNVAAEANGTTLLTSEDQAATEQTPDSNEKVRHA